MNAEAACRQNCRQSRTTGPDYSRDYFEMTEVTVGYILLFRSVVCFVGDTAACVNIQALSGHLRLKGIERQSRMASKQTQFSTNWHFDEKRRFQLQHSSEK